MKQLAAYEIKTMILIEKTRIAMTQNTIDVRDDRWAKLQAQKIALTDLQREIEDKYNLKNQ